MNLKILGIDYGRSKIGLAIADGSLAEPMRVIRYKDTKILSEQIMKIVEQEKIEKIIFGISEGEMGEESKNFSLNFGKIVKIPIETFDPFHPRCSKNEHGSGNRTEKTPSNGGCLCRRHHASKLFGF
jgi:RNase H-fold protein (predicted Holliday junction resolvase)